MSKESFLDLLDRYLHDKCTEEEEFSVETWYHSLNRKDHNLLTSTQLSEMSDRVLERLHADMESKNKRNAFKINWYLPAVAASIAIVMLSAILYGYQYNNAEHAFKEENKGHTLLSKTNHTANSILVKLSDNSIVTLHPNATIIYPDVFSKENRLVYLRGNAFFLVSKNHRKPFIVYNKKLQVKVLGTSFFINEAVSQVSVSTGKVQVNENENRGLFNLPGKKHIRGVLITPNQKAIFDDEHHQLKKMLVDRPLPLYQLYKQPSCTQFKFAETSLKDVFQALSKGYGISITLEDQAIYHCTFTGDLENKSLHEQLNLICQSISGSYIIRNTEILIKGKNCN